MTKDLQDENVELKHQLTEAKEQLHSISEENTNLRKWVQDLETNLAHDQVQLEDEEAADETSIDNSTVSGTGWAIDLYSPTDSTFLSDDNCFVQ